jgi:hypothetical protein
MEILTFLALLLVCFIHASANYKLGRIARALERLADSTERIAEVELPVLSAAVSETLEPLDILNPN